MIRSAYFIIMIIILKYGVMLATPPEYNLDVTLLYIDKLNTKHEQGQIDEQSSTTSQSAINDQNPDSSSLTTLTSRGNDGSRDQEGKETKAIPSPTKIADGLEVNHEKQEVWMDAKLILTQGILEFLVITPGGREHEAVFTSKVKASSLHFALLIAGLIPNGTVSLKHEWSSEQLSNIKPSRVKIDMQYHKGGDIFRIPVIDILNNREATDGQAPDKWIFSGSYFSKGKDKPVYTGDIQDVIVSIIPNMEAVINYATDLSNPYLSSFDIDEDDDEHEQYGVEVGDIDIKAGTPVKLIFSPWNEHLE